MRGTGSLVRREVLQDLEICLAEGPITESQFLDGYKGIKMEDAYMSAFAVLKENGLVKVEGDGCLWSNSVDKDSLVKIPPAFVELLGRKYWHQASKEQLWAWIEAIGTSRSNGDSLQDAIESCGSEDWLLSGNPYLDRCGENHGPDATWLEIFGHEHRAMQRQGKLTCHDDVCLVIWCTKRLEELEKKKEAA